MSIRKLSKLIEQNVEKEIESCLFIGVSSNTNEVSTIIKGNTQLLSQAFNAKMNNSPEFNRLVTSMFGAYLNCNPDQKQMFIKGMDITNNLPGVN